MGKGSEARAGQHDVNDGHYRGQAIKPGSISRAVKGTMESVIKEKKEEKFNGPIPAISFSIQRDINLLRFRNSTLRALTIAFT